MNPLHENPTPLEVIAKLRESLDLASVDAVTLEGIEKVDLPDAGQGNRRMFIEVASVHANNLQASLTEALGLTYLLVRYYWYHPDHPNQHPFDDDETRAFIHNLAIALGIDEETERG